MKLTVALTFACLVFCALPQGASAFESYLLWDSTASHDLKPFYKWNTMVERYDSEQDTPDEQCDQVKFHPCEIVRWKEMVGSLKGKSFLDQLNAVNDYANHFPYITDPVNWGVEDYWETPHEFLTVSGNCKDYAIIKYYSLRMLGVPAENLRVIILQDLNLGGVVHAILGVYHDGELYILDNQIKQVILAKNIYHYRPIYAINENTWWRYIQR